MSMDILLVNPPNCGRSIPEERYGIDSFRQIFRGEPLALEVLAGNLAPHQVIILDLKASSFDLADYLSRHHPDIIAFTAMTCEANTVVALAQTARRCGDAVIVIGGIHASADPEFFNRAPFDFIVIGLGEFSFAELVAALERDETAPEIPGVAATCPGAPLRWQPRDYRRDNYGNTPPPRYDLVRHYRDSYVIRNLNIAMGYVVSAFGCPYRCSFCSISAQTGGRYLTRDCATVVRDLSLLPDSSFIRLVDANTFGSLAHAEELCRAIAAADAGKQYLLDVRADTVVRQPHLLEQWRDIGLRAVVIGFEEIDDTRLQAMNKSAAARLNSEALDILHQLGISVIGDFIVDPEYTECDFDRLHDYIGTHAIDLPMITIMTPLPGTQLYRQMCGEITEHNLDYYTLTNAVTRTRLEEKRFYTRYAQLIRHCHSRASI